MRVSGTDTERWKAPGFERCGWGHCHHRISPGNDDLGQTSKSRSSVHAANCFEDCPQVISPGRSKAQVSNGI